MIINALSAKITLLFKITNVNAMTDFSFKSLQFNASLVNQNVTCVKMAKIVHLAKAPRDHIIKQTTFHANVLKISFLIVGLQISIAFLVKTIV